MIEDTIPDKIFKDFHLWNWDKTNCKLINVNANNAPWLAWSPCNPSKGCPASTSSGILCCKENSNENNINEVIIVATLKNNILFKFKYWTNRMINLKLNISARRSDNNFENKSSNVLSHGFGLPTVYI